MNSHALSDTETDVHSVRYVRRTFLASEWNDVVHHHGVIATYETKRSNTGICHGTDMVYILDDRQN